MKSYFSPFGCQEIPSFTIEQVWLNLNEGDLNRMEWKLLDWDSLKLTEIEQNQEKSMMTIEVDSIFSRSVGEWTSKICMEGGVNNA